MGETISSASAAPGSASDCATSTCCAGERGARSGGAEDRFRGLLEAAPDAMIIVDDTGTITLVNAQTEALFGYGREELLGRTVDLLVPDRFRT
ncbi:PAS domain-containing protein, partial [Streptomyces mirabilis]|uniref:PAS domain-containing protein n=1 Tax=Streptomyces mirabilis TaxID=68239 RepID=UPI0036C28FE3